MMRLPCRNGGWNDQTATYTNFCYTDIYPLYFDRQLATQNPYFADVPFDKHVEYPVVLGEVMQVIAWIVRWLEQDVAAQAARFYDITVVLMGLSLVARRAADGRRRRADPPLGRRLVRARARGRAGRLHQLGPRRRRAVHGHAPGLGAQAAGAGRACCWGWPSPRSSTR
ncbi:hypothetical protein ACFSTC_57970 [Nonomuraea ferruginea]